MTEVTSIELTIKACPTCSGRGMFTRRDPCTKSSTMETCNRCDHTGGILLDEYGQECRLVYGVEGH